MDEYDKIAIGGIVFLGILFLAFSVGVTLGLLGMADDLAKQVQACRGNSYVSTDNK